MNVLASASAILSGILWGSSGLFLRYLSQDYDLSGITIVFTKMVVSLFIMFFAILIKGRHLFRVKLKNLFVAALGSISGMLLMNLAYTKAANMLSISLAAVLLCTMPVFALFLAAIFFKEKITLLKIICISCCLFGCTLVSGLFEGKIIYSFSGILFGVVSAALYAVYNICSKIATEKQGVHVFTFLFYGFLINFIVAIPFTDYGSLKTCISAAPAFSLALLIGSAILTNLLPYALLNFALCKGDVGKVAIVATSIEPLAATVFAAIFLDEIPSVLAVFGIIITIIAVCVVGRENK